jgi:hypothetical protein
LEFYSEDPTNTGPKVTGAIKSIADEAGTGDPSGSMGFYTIQANGSLSEGMRLHRTGSLKIGAPTVAPAAGLHLATTLQVGISDTGHDVKFYGATANDLMHWDESRDSLLLLGGAKLGVGSSAFTPVSELELLSKTHQTAPTLTMTLSENAIVNNHVLANIDFRGSDTDGSGNTGQAYARVGARIKAVADETWGTDVDDNPTRLEFMTQTDGNTDELATRMTLNREGQLGVGLNFRTPDTILDIRSLDSGVAYHDIITWGVATTAAGSANHPARLGTGSGFTDNDSAYWSLNWKDNGDHDAGGAGAKDEAGWTAVQIALKNSIDDNEADTGILFRAVEDDDTGDLATKMVMLPNGNFGIGDTSPTTAPLVIKQTAAAASIEDTPVMHINNQQAAAAWSTIRFQTYSGYSDENWYIGAYGNSTAANRRFSFGNQSGTEVLSMTQAGNVGIGYTTPYTALQIVSADSILRFGGGNDGTGSTEYSIDVQNSQSGDNSGNGRSLLISAGSTDNAASKTGGNLTLKPGLAVSPATAHGNVLIAPTGGKVIIGADDEGDDVKAFGATTGAYMLWDASADKLSLNQGTTTSDALELRSPQVAHGLTSQRETDVYAGFTRLTDANGGLELRTFCEDAGSTTFNLDSMGGTASTTQSVSNQGLINFNVRQRTGTNIGDVADGGNIFSVKAQSPSESLETKFMVDEDGDIYSVTSAQTFDEYDDAQMVRALDQVKGNVIRDKWDDYVQYNEQVLIDAEVLGAPIAEGGLTNVTQLQRLHNGAIWQGYVRQEEAQERIEELEYKLERFGDIDKKFIELEKLEKRLRALEGGK